MEFKVQNDLLTIFFEGRVDSANAASVAQEVENILAQNPTQNVAIDGENLEYLSSAGLRVVLSVRKKIPQLKLVNISSEVYEILEMTGFTEMMTVEKAYRKINVDGCEVIGQGANGKVYRIDPDTIVKVYLNPDSLPDIHRERELARCAFVRGVNTAIPYDVVKIEGGGYGSVFELLNAKSLAKMIATDPASIDTCVKYSIDLLKTIHGTTVDPDEMPSMKAVAVDWANFVKAYLPEKEGAKLCQMMQDIPEKLTMLHGDYHIKNVMVQNGEVLLIDMDTLCYGDPVFEFASIYNAYEGFLLNDGSDFATFLGIPKKTASYILRKTFELYFNETDEEKLNEKLNKAKVIGFTRLIRRSIRRGGLEKDAENVKADIARLTDLINQVDNLIL